MKRTTTKSSSGTASDAASDASKANFVLPLFDADLWNAVKAVEHGAMHARSRVRAAFIVAYYSTGRIDAIVVIRRRRSRRSTVVRARSA